MATVAQVQDVLGRTEKSPQIMQTHHLSSVRTQYYVNGGSAYAGRSRWVECNVSDSAATQAAAIVTKLKE